jgi:uncharacterized protein (TIGR00369 family)
MAANLKDDRWCFACGPDNPHGLHLENFHTEGELHVVEFVPQRHHQGWQGLAHGGIVATVLDEIMTRMLYDQGKPGVTAELTVRYHQPLPTGERVQATARLVEQRKRLVRTAGELRDASGELIASAQAKFMLTRL